VKLTRALHLKKCEGHKNGQEKQRALQRKSLRAKNASKKSVLDPMRFEKKKV
jgi:hypothetical protein